MAREALIRRWPRLQEWLDSNRERLRRTTSWTSRAALAGAGARPRRPPARRALALPRRWLPTTRRHSRRWRTISVRRLAAIAAESGRASPPPAHPPGRAPGARRRRAHFWGRLSGHGAAAIGPELLRLSEQPAGRAHRRRFWSAAGHDRRFAAHFQRRPSPLAARARWRAGRRGRLPPAVLLPDVDRGPAERAARPPAARALPGRPAGTGHRAGPHLAAARAAAVLAPLPGIAAAGALALLLGDQVGRPLPAYRGCSSRWPEPPYRRPSWAPPSWPAPGATHTKRRTATKRNSASSQADPPFPSHRCQAGRQARTTRRR